MRYVQSSSVPNNLTDRVMSNTEVWIHNDFASKPYELTTQHYKQPTLILYKDSIYVFNVYEMLSSAF